MAKRKENKPLYKAIRDFFDFCLIQDRSLLWPDEEYWTLANLYEVKKRMVDSPILGRELSFEEKLEKQMKGSSANLWAIIADIYYIYFLPSTFITIEKKQHDIQWAASQGGLIPPSNDANIWVPQIHGFTRTSMKYHVKYSQFWLIILFSIFIKENEDPNPFINEPQKIQQALDLSLDNIPNKIDRAYDMRHAMLYMAFPDHYERMISTRDKERLVDKYGKLIEGQMPSDIDESIRKIRECLSKTHDTPERLFDFYSDMKEEWRKPKKDKKPKKKPFLPKADARNFWIFQANPKYFDLEGSLKVLKEHRWSINQHKDKIHAGDTIYLWQSGSNSGIYAIGTVMTEPKEMHEDERELPFVKSTEKFKELELRSIVRVNKVLKKTILRNDLLKHAGLSTLSILAQPAGTNFSVTSEQGAALRVLTDKDPGLEITTLKKTWKETKESLNLSNFGQDFGIYSLYFKNEDQIKSQVRVALQNGKNIILIGPPGTGKSKLAVAICEYYCGSNNYIMSTATSDWSTFETIGGYRPDREGSLIFHPGIFLQCFHDKESSPINKWLIIDEINRADIDKAFGSLFSALTGDNITLPFDISGEQLKLIGDPKDKTKIAENQFIIHPHWRIIATMNTFDKTSLYEMSYAFMRRFAFVPVDVPLNSNSNLIKTYLDIWGLETNEIICENLSTLWGIINSKRKIGPAIIQDLYRYVLGIDPHDYVGGIIMYVLPQFEGLLEETQIEFIREVASLEFINKPKELKHFASDFLGLDIKKLE